MCITRSQRTGKIHFCFRISVCSRSGQVVVQHIEVNEIFISTRKEVSLDLDFRLSLFYSSVSEW